ncbi:hypothetical protein [Pseudomonas saxonica]|uniref:hypothetical protein n=1 Tax=Pseudomonas saxonica TaxID=2600598 RepID=UPI002D79011A|nr:hypothetical protein [Pseudomonas saxonica]WRQ76476.1 hypothetical protein VQY67_07685 [Pseudomonas saxonica]
MSEDHHSQSHDPSSPPVRLVFPWELVTPIEDTGICSGISVVEFNHKIYAFFMVENFPGHLGLSYLVLGNNAENKLVEQKQEYLDAIHPARGRPAVTVHEGHLFCFYTTLEQTVLYHVFSGEHWTHAQEVPGVLTQHAPSVSSTNGQLYLGVQGTSNGEFYHKIFENYEWGNTIKASGIRFKGTPSLAGNGSRMYAALTGADDSVGLYAFHSNSWELLYRSNFYKVQGSPTLYAGGSMLMCTSVNAHDQRAVTEVLGAQMLDITHPQLPYYLNVTNGKYLSEPSIIYVGEELYLIGRRPCNDVGISLYKPPISG